MQLRVNLKRVRNDDRRKTFSDADKQQKSYGFIARVIKVTIAEGPHPLRHRMGAFPLVGEALIL